MRREGKRGREETERGPREGESREFVAKMAGLYRNQKLGVGGSKASALEKFRGRAGLRRAEWSHRCRGSLGSVSFSMLTSTLVSNLFQVSFGPGTKTCTLCCV